MRMRSINLREGDRNGRKHKISPFLTEIKVDIENFKNDMEKASAIGTSEAKRISKVMETTAKVGKNFSKAGDLLTKGLTLPIVGVGAATTKMAVDFESSFVKSKYTSGFKCRRFCTVQK